MSYRDQEDYKRDTALTCWRLIMHVGPDHKQTKYIIDRWYAACDQLLDPPSIRVVIR